MSIIDALLGWIGWPKWAVELLALVLVGALIAAGIEHVKAEGRAQEHAAEVAAVEKDQKALKAKIDVAEHAHDQELTDLRAFRDSHPDALFVCPSAGVRKAPAPQRPAGAGPVAVQPVPAGGDSVGPVRAPRDIFPMLDNLAGHADQDSAELRARQRVEP